MPDVSVVVPTRNRPKAVRVLLDSIAAQKRVEPEVVLVDDASDTPLVVSSDWQLPIRVLRQNRSVGACRARNLGVAAASADWLVFVDDDVEFADDGVLGRLLDFATNKPDFGVFAFAELDAKRCWGFNLGPEGPPLEVARFFGCGVAFRRKCFEATAGFFEPLGYYYEEFELSMRVIDCGWRLVFNPDLQIIHYRDTTGRDPRRIQRLIARNALLTASCRFPWWMVAPAWASQLGRFAAKSWLHKPVDPLGPAGVAASALGLSVRYARQRRPVSSRALRRYRSLAASPQPLEELTTPSVEGATCRAS